MKEIYKHRLVVAVGAALEAGREILKVYNAGHNVDVEYKKDSSPLTAADKRAHAVIRLRLTNAFPAVPFLSEEGRHAPYAERRKWKQYWLVDPLDGTKDFIKRNGEFTVNIALVEDDEPVLGVIFLPVKDVLYFAAKDVGAYRARNCLKDEDGGAEIIAGASPIPDAHPAPAGTVRVVASRNHMNDETRSYIDSLVRRFAGVETVHCGSSLKICAVAEGTADLYPRFGPTNEWDIAAGYAIAVAAGCSMTKIDGSRLTFNKEDLLNPFFIVKSGRFPGKGLEPTPE